MIPEIGQFALAMALLVALVQGIVPLWGAQAGRQAWMAVASPAAAIQLVLVLVAFGCLMQAFVTSDFSVVNVVANSHTAKPMLYKIAGVWGNHEGSLLLWVLILALFGAAVAAFGGNLPSGLRARVLSIQGLIGVGFLLFILFTSNPFERIFPAPLDGRGLNPLLQDPGLAFHPPFLYLGYVGFSVAFAFAVAALIEGRVDPAWARWVRPWTLAAWCFLTCGIALGSWWAYYELGWGGWWFWDPVENASFMPWLAGTALLHSAVVVEKRDALKSWTILLAIVAFSFSLLGTFLVRSGVLTSVHAFATDPARGVFILAFLVVVTGGSLALFAVRAQSLKSGGLFAPISREGGLVLNNLLLGTAAATVLLGTLYPLFLDGMTGEKVSVGPPYFNGVFVPLMTPLVIFMVIGPMLRWKRGDLAGVLSRLKLAYGAVVAVLVAVSVSRGGDAGLMPMLGIGLGVWLLAGTMVGWAERVRLFQIPLPESFRLIRHLRRSDWGMTIAHGAVAIMIFGIAVSDAWQIERQQNIRPGDEIDLGHYVALFEGAEVVQGPNYKALRGNFRIFRDGDEIMTMQPERRNYETPPMDTTEAAILPTITGDLYVVIGEPDGTGGYASRLYFKPLVSWIWGGALLMVVGGMVSLSDRKHRIGAPTRRKDTGAPASAAKVSP